MSAVLACSLYIHEFPDHCHSLVFLVVILGRACTPRQNFLSLHHSAGRHSEGGRTGAEGLNPAVDSIDDEDSSSPPPAEETNRKFLFYPMPMGRPSRAALTFSARLSPSSVAPLSRRLDTSRTRHRVRYVPFFLSSSFLSFPPKRFRQFLLFLEYLSLSFLSSPSVRQEGEEERKREGKAFRP